MKIIKVGRKEGRKEGERDTHLHIVGDDKNGHVSEEERHDNQDGLRVVIVMDKCSGEICDSCNHPCTNEEKHCVVRFCNVLFLSLFTPTMV